jgi:hypothetical protein
MREQPEYFRQHGAKVGLSWVTPDTLKDSTFRQEECNDQ